MKSVQSICLVFVLSFFACGVGADSISSANLDALDRKNYQTHAVVYGDYFGREKPSEDDTSGGHKLEFERAIGVNDSIEGFNRCMHGANDVLMLWFLRPFGRGYAILIPHTGREVVNNVAINVEVPVRVGSLLCQARLSDAGEESCRFLVNTVIGVAGAWDPAKILFGMKGYDEDFGQAFATWGIGPGCYLSLPLQGPSTIRDAFGLIFDIGLDPKTYIPVPGVGWFIRFNKASLSVDQYERLVDTFDDPYINIRDFWYILRKVKICR